MYKYKKPLTEDEINVLTRLSEMNFLNFTETDVREEFLTPLLTLLGYQKNTDYEVEREESFSTREMSLNIGREKIKLDYIFNIRKRNFWIIEAKNGKKQEILQEELQQAYFYSLHPDINCRYFVVSNGWFLNLYDRNKFLSGDNTTIFEPILEIKHTEIKKKFDLLYKKIGASNIIFNVKEDCLLKEIEKTLSAEIYPNRLDYFLDKVTRIVRKSKVEVYNNIRNFKNNTPDSQYNVFKEYLEGNDLDNIINVVLNSFLNKKTYDIAYPIIKFKLLEHKQYLPNIEGYCSFDWFFDVLFIRKIRVVKFQYFYNIVLLLVSFLNDSDLSKMYYRYGDKKIKVDNILREYLLELFNFFPDRPEYRLLITVYPMMYRYSKYFFYCSPVAKNKAIQNLKQQEYLLTEEELSNIYPSKGMELVNLSQNMTVLLMEHFIDKVMSRGKIQPELIKKMIRDLDQLIINLEKDINLTQLKRELPDGELDEMFAIDNHYNDPWSYLFTFVLNILKDEGYKLEDDLLKDRVKLLEEQGFINLRQPLSGDRLKEKEKIFNQLKYDY